MKKIIALMLALLMVFALAACDSSEPADTTPSTPTGAPTDPTDAPAEPTDAPTEPTEEPTEPAAAPDVNVLAHYTFDGVEGTLVPDSGANKYDGTAFGEPEFVEGKNGTGMKLKGDNGVTIPVGAGTVGTKFTVSAWIKIEEGSPSRPYRILSTGVWGDSTTGFQLGVDTSYGKGCFVYCVGNANGPCYWNRQTEFSNPLMDGQWHHIAISFDTETLLAVGFLDGVMMDIMVLPGTTDVTPWSALTELCIGGAYVGGSLGEPFVGTLDDVAVTDYFFTEADIAYLMDGTVLQ